jgi:hypothetical protein
MNTIRAHAESRSKLKREKAWSSTRQTIKAWLRLYKKKTELLQNEILNLDQMSFSCRRQQPSSMAAFIEATTKIKNSMRARYVTMGNHQSRKIS